MPQCSVLQGCKSLAVLLRGLRMDACRSARLAGFTAVDSDATRFLLRSNSRAIQLGAAASVSDTLETKTHACSPTELVTQTRTILSIC